MKVVNRVERHILKPSAELDTLCFKSKNLYNYCNYILRQAFIETRKIPSEYELSKQLTLEKPEAWALMQGNTNQQVLKALYKNWKSFFEACKEYKKNPSKFTGRPKLPKYKDKEKGRNFINFSCSNKSNIKSGYFIFPKFTGLKPIKTSVTNDTLRCARIIPETSCYIFEIVYKLEVPDCNSSSKYLTIDLGVNNFATCFNGTDNSSFIINGKVIKSYNQWYNKEKARLQSELIRCNNEYTSRRIDKLGLKRENKINDYMHKTSKLLIDYCLNNNIDTIVVGHNKQWKTNCRVGKATTQKFVCIPYNKFINMLAYKCENAGINFIVTEESYTSKIDHLAKEEMKHQDVYLGKRVHRGLFKSSVNQVINADVNGALGILRKVINESQFEEIIDRGHVICPFKINIYDYK